MTSYTAHRNTKDSMFNIIITVMALAFVVILGAITTTNLSADKGVNATGRNAITATQALVQGQQLTSQAMFFHALQGRWPDSVEELISAGYLADEPKMNIPPDDFATSHSTYTKEVKWQVPVPGNPLFQVGVNVSETPCRELNKQARGDNGILTLASRDLLAQCFGTPGNYRIVVSATQDAVAAAFPGSLLPQGVTIQGLVVDGASPYWTVAPNEADTQ